MEEKVGFFKRLKNGLSKTRDSFVSGIDSLFTGFSEIDDDFYEELEELLVMGDIGINTTMSIIDGLKERVKEEKIKEASACKQLLIDTIKAVSYTHLISTGLKKYLPVFTHLLKPLICNSQFGLTKTLMNSSGLTKPALNKIISSSKSTSTTSKSK